MQTQIELIYLPTLELLSNVTLSHFEEFTELPAESITESIVHRVFNNIFNGNLEQDLILADIYGILSQFFIPRLCGVSPVPIIKVKLDAHIINFINEVKRVIACYNIISYSFCTTLVECTVTSK